jgi:hypothetical protein
MRASGRLGCLSGLGVLAAFITALVIAGYVYAQGGVLYSPGPLNAQSGKMLGGVTSHARTGGNCKACHTAPWESARMEDRCVVCHGNIAVQMKDVATLHGSLLTDQPDLRCRFCHPEHRGADASLTEMNGAAFPHEAVGFSLKGHQFKVTREAFVCSDCHTVDISTFDLQTCDTCHRQMDLGFITGHVLSFGSACLDCHDGVDSLVTGLNHNNFAFKLTGKHGGVACVKCHVDARTLGDFAEAPQDCYSCHRQDDEHNGQFGMDCAACHNPSDWENATFDHSRSNFPLTGAHVNVTCERCHTGGQFKGLSAACAACHTEPAFHAGLFGTDCAACHSTAAWAPAQFNGPHTFPLNHGGGATCATCHPSGFTTYTCYGCHEHNETKVRSEHLEEGISNFQDCMRCHPTGQGHEGGEGGGDD